MATESSELEEEGKITGGISASWLKMISEKWERLLLGVSALASPAMGSPTSATTTLIPIGIFPNLLMVPEEGQAAIALYVDFKLDESYTPSKISVRAGDGFHNLKLYLHVLLHHCSIYFHLQNFEIKIMELVRPTGWIYLSLSGNDPQGTFVSTFMLQFAVLSNHLNGRDTHFLQIKVYGPQPNPIPCHPFQFTSIEFITYSTVR
ncbi:hypothetical protein SLEP1_g12062 [Rubroshorea leprosula]|nr:hypothetical protein SLEP1_g12062 [Rubroshorea leprosula]